jgi:phosphoribosylformylglycinamidine (FGAM) synthase-like enzyme
VMTNTVVLPGSDAAVIRIKGTKKGAAANANVNSRYCYLDPHLGGQIAVAESARNLVCSGAKPLALTDCLNFGNPQRPEIMWQFEQAVLGISEACNFFEIPVVSGNVSFYNETNEESIYPTPTIGMVGLLDDVEKRLDQFFKNEGDVIFLLGENKDELGASEYLAQIHGKVAGRVPELHSKAEKSLWEVILNLIEISVLSSAHDISEGGLAIALAESCFGTNIVGASVQLDELFRADALLFGETQSRVLISCKKEVAGHVIDQARQAKVPCKQIGSVGGERLVISPRHGKAWIDLAIKGVHQWWKNGFEQTIFGH